MGTREKIDGGKQRRGKGFIQEENLALQLQEQARGMGDGSDGTDMSPESEAAAEKGGEIWGTLEELLLACAVTRHGTSSWDSVAMEVQTRSPLAARPGLTPHSCRLRFRYLHRRFSNVGGAGEEEVGDGNGDDPDASAAEGWVDELRRLRVAELRRDVERCDLSIGTLQSKVKRLREERARSLSGAAKPDAASGNDRLSGEEPGRSCRESNSTDLKPPKHPGAVKEEEVAKQEASGESAAASKESSEVRSTASLCRRRRSSSGKTSGNEEEEAASTPRPLPAQSTPPSALLDAVAAKLGPVMERLREHESEEGAAYRGMIRRHVDLETVRTKLEATTASRADDDDCYPASEFYRDLLLLCTNAVVFFPRSEPEHAAAVEARGLVSEHASTVLREPKQEHVAAAVPVPAPGPAPAGGDIVGPLIEKVKPLIFCRKRSSIAKAAAMKKETAEKAEPEKEHAESEEEKEAVAAGPREKAWGLRTKKRGGAVRRLAGTRLTDDAATKDGAKKGAPGVGAAAGGLAKKRNAVDFLKRLNQGSSPTKKRGSPLGTTRRRSASRAATEEQPKTRRRGTGRMDGTGRGGGTKRGGKAGAAKRGVGRPLKRGAAPSTPPPSKRAKTSRSDKPATGKRRGRRSVG